MGSSIISWFVALIFLSFTFNNFSQARNLKKLNSVVVVGTVYCDTCNQEDFSKARNLIPGALVAVECENGSSKTTFRQEAKTNENGEFKVRLPFYLAKHKKKIKGCTVNLIKTREPFCTVASSKKFSTLYLESRKQGTRVFSAGLFTFKPLNQLELCNKNPEKELISKKKILPPFPPNPLQPPSIFPPIPNPFQPPPSIFPPFPNPFQPPPSIFPPIPNPLQPPPSIFPPIPNPFQPPPSIFPPIPSPLQPPPSVFPPLIPGLIPSPPPPAFLIPGLPNPFQPPPSIFPPINFPPLIPGLIPSPPPPPPPVFPIPLPPFPFPPAPVFPGFPPSSKKTSP